MASGKCFRRCPGVVRSGRGLDSVSVDGAQGDRVEAIDKGIDTNVERAVEAWLEMMGPPTPGSVRARLIEVVPSVAPGLVEIVRDRFRQHFLNRASRDRTLVISSLDEAIDEARVYCSRWEPLDFVVFCWWIRCSSAFGWTTVSRGWQAKILDAIAADLPHESVRGATFHAWKMGPNPQEFLLTNRWRELFSGDGYIDDTEVVPRPASGHLVLYRGSNWETRANWSWTSIFRIANIYRETHGGPNGLVWVALVPWQNVLAWQPYAEYVVDTMRRDGRGSMISIRPLDLPVRRSHWPHCKTGRTGRLAAMFTAHRCQECGAQVDGKSFGDPFETVFDAFHGRRSATWRR